MSRQRRKFANELIITKLDRLKELNLWFPYPCIISFFLALLLIGHLLVGLNPRLGNPANILSFASAPSEEGAIWLSVSIRDKKILVTSSDRKVFTWP